MPREVSFEGTCLQEQLELPELEYLRQTSSTISSPASSTPNRSARFDSIKKFYEYLGFIACILVTLGNTGKTQDLDKTSSFKGGSIQQTVWMLQ
jgi:hypothetical protein